MLLVHAEAEQDVHAPGQQVVAAGLVAPEDADLGGGEDPVQVAVGKIGVANAGQALFQGLGLGRWQPARKDQALAEGGPGQHRHAAHGPDWPHGREQKGLHDLARLQDAGVLLGRLQQNAQAQPLAFQLLAQGLPLVRAGCGCAWGRVHVT